MKSWDVIIIGGGMIGLSLSLALRKRGATVLVVERGEPGREASHAAGGMLADCILETPPALQALATASARLYPEFVRELQLESEINIDLRDQGTILLLTTEHASMSPEFKLANQLPAPLSKLEPALTETSLPAFYLKERSVDPRRLTTAAWQTAKRRGVDFSSGDTVTAVEISAAKTAAPVAVPIKDRLLKVTTTKTSFQSPTVVNCAGAWAGQIPPHAFPTRPVKGQMLCLIAPSPTLLKHVIRTPEVYLIPRSDGRIIVGSTIEEAGFDKRTDVPTIQRLHREAIALIPELKNAKILEDWAGLRPGTPDELPLLGVTTTPGYYVATGHFRDGILLAPITAQVMADGIEGRECGYDLTPFSPARFSY